MEPSISVADRPFLIGNGELKQYLGVTDDRTLRTNFIDRGLKPKVIGSKMYYFKADIEKFIKLHDSNRKVGKK